MRHIACGTTHPIPARNGCGSRELDTDNVVKCLGAMDALLNWKRIQSTTLLAEVQVSDVKWLGHHHMEGEAGWFVRCCFRSPYGYNAAAI